MPCNRGGPFVRPCPASKKLPLPASARSDTTNCFLHIRPSSGRENGFSFPGWAARVRPSQLLLVVVKLRSPSEGRADYRARNSKCLSVLLRLFDWLLKIALFTRPREILFTQGNLQHPFKGQHVHGEPALPYGHAQQQAPSAAQVKQFARDTQFQNSSVRCRDERLRV